jgi:drug/metabolite transporter (DMT)-like permease
MFTGIAFALGACCIWGLIFVVPQFMSGFTSIEVSLGRYLFYGLISSALFLKAKCQGRCRYPRSIWKKALLLSLVTVVGYTCLILSLRYSTPAVSALILGISPIAMAFYGNWRQKEVPFRSLITPSVLILLGLVMINLPHLKESSSPSFYILGLLCSVAALTAWSWYVVANSRFLKSHPEVHSNEWSTLIGIGTLVWVVIGALCFVLFFGDHLHKKAYMTLNPELIRFLIGGAILGLLCSWVGAFLWNRASLSLPTSLTGQLTIFETLFGVLFVYLIEQRAPPMIEGIGIVILLVAIIYGIRQFTSRAVA